jgi:CubicO group peptidase (beta-lactamase class C family)
MKSLTAFLFILLFTVIMQTLNAQSNTLMPSSGSVDSFIQQTMRKTGIVGLGAAIIVDRKIVWSQAYGFADLQNEKPFLTSTIMNIGSVAKNFTGVCLMKAVEEKKLSLDEDINKYLPFKVINPYYPHAKITLRNLATHSSSLTDREPFYGSTYLYGAGDSPQSLGDFLRNYFTPEGKHYSKENFLNHAPGSYYQYGNIPAALAGYIVECVTGKTLQEYGRQIIFTPLQMENTGWALAEIDQSLHTKLYEKRGGDTLLTIPLYSFPTYPEGGVRTNVSALAKYFACLLNDGEYKGVRILSKASVVAMQTFQFTAANKPGNVNLAKQNSGIFWSTKMGATRIGHNGSDPGVRVFMLSDLSKEIGVVLFINTTLSDDNIPFKIYEELYKYGAELKKNNRK